MPITPTYEWEETERTLVVRVQLPSAGASRSKADIFATDCMLKVNIAPYLLILDLFGTVDDAQTVATVTREEVLFKLVKAGKGGIWGQLEPIADKDEITKRRNESIDRAHAKVAEAHRQRLEQKQRDEKEATERQIEMERTRRNRIEAAKKAELDSERQKLVDWQKQLSGGQEGASGSRPAGAGDGGDESDYEDEDEEEAANGGAAGAKEREEGQKAMEDHPEYYGKGFKRPDGYVASAKASSSSSAAAEARAQRLLEDSDEEDREEERRRAAAAKAAESEDEGGDEGPGAAVSFRPLPPPRIRLQAVPVEFTKLETGHLPAREHREEEIKLYKKNLAADQKLLGDSVDVADRQPVFLKDKGDGLYKQGNYRGAVNAYARALELDPEFSPALWSNAAASFFQLGEFETCVNNCYRAIEMLEKMKKRMFDSESVHPADREAFRKQLVKALVRRGQAQAKLGHLPEAEADYSEALKYDSGNASLASDLQELHAAMQPADVTTLRQRGNARFQAKDYEGAMQAFSLLLAMPSHAAVPDSERLAALSNRAACFLVTEQYAEAVQDCTSALGMHLRDFAAATRPGDATSSSTSGCSPSDLRAFVDAVKASPEWAESRVAGISRLAARRGAAYAYMREFEKSVLDYESAAELARLAGDAAKQAQLLEDAARCRSMQLDAPA